MKNTLFFALLLCSLSALQAQTSDPIKDTTIITNVGGVFFEVRRIEYADGAYSETSGKIGDTTAMVSVYVNRIASESDQLAQAAATAYRMRQRTTEWTRLDTVVTQRLLRSPITGIMDSYEREFLQGNWQIEFSGTTTAATFPRLTSNKRIRLQPATGGTPRTMRIYGKNMEITNYPFTGKNVLFQLREGYWINLEYGNPATRIVLRRISN
jgi:hypothetical protein